MPHDTRKQALPLNQQIEEFLTELEAVGPHSRRDHVHLGFTLTDYLLGGGLRPGEVSLVSGTSNIGKSSLAANITRNVAINDRLGVLVYSLQKTVSAFMLSVLATSRGLNRDSLDREVLSHPQWSELTSHNSFGVHGCIHLQDSAGISSLGDLTDSITKACEGEFSPSLIIIDNLQMLVGGEQPGAALEQVLTRLKRTAAEMSAPVLLLSHVNIPTQVPFELYRLVDNAFILAETKNRHELQCTKNAHGGSFRVPLQFNADTGAFSELTTTPPDTALPLPNKVIGVVPLPASFSEELQELRARTETHRPLLTRHGHIGPLQQKLTTLEEQVSSCGQHTSASMKHRLALQIQNALTTLGLEQQRIIEACHLNQTFECAYHEASNDMGPLLTTEEVAERLAMPASNVDHAMRKAGFHRIRIPYANSGYPRIFWTQRDCEALKSVPG